jgi:hypothetical protein
MTDLSKAIEPKSDQLNADDLIAGPKTLKITGVKVKTGEQAVSIHYEGDNGKPWKPCKSMVRLMVQAWGTTNGDEYVGRRVTVYNDPRVKWAGTEVGGIRISHMSHIDKELRVMLTESRGRKSPVTVLPLETKPVKELTDAEFGAFQADIDSAESMAELSTIAKKIKAGNYDEDGSAKLREIYSAAVDKLRD